MEVTRSKKPANAPMDLTTLQSIAVALRYALRPFYDMGDWDNQETRVKLEAAEKAVTKALKEAGTPLP